MNVDNPEAVITTSSDNEKNLKTNLIHEIGHATRADKGLQTSNNVNEEIAASHIENKVRGEMNLPLRTHYDIIIKFPISF